MGAKFDRFKREAKQGLDRMIRLGGYEIGGLWTGNAFRGDLGMYSSPNTSSNPTENSGVHGPQATDAPPEATLDPGIERESAQLQQAAQWFDGMAQSERASFAVRTPAERESVLDQWQTSAQATRDASQERGEAPPMWSVMNREEMKEAFTPSAQELKAAEPGDIAGQGMKERSLAKGPDPVEQMRQSARQQLSERSRNRGMEM